jgi:hypothetical protein
VRAGEPDFRHGRLKLDVRDPGGVVVGVLLPLPAPEARMDLLKLAVLKLISFENLKLASLIPFCVLSLSPFTLSLKLISFDTRLKLASLDICTASWSRRVLVSVDVRKRMSIRMSARDFRLTNLFCVVLESLRAGPLSAPKGNQGAIRQISNIGRALASLRAALGRTVYVVFYV